MGMKSRGLRVLERRHLLMACLICTMLPDIDFFGLKMNVQYDSLFGHRGFTHSIFFAVIVALVAGWILNRPVRGDIRNYAKLFLLLFLATLSHPLLDAMTDGGEGVAFFSPFSNHRYFFSYRPIMVSPLGLEAFLSWRGLFVLIDELLIVIVPVGMILFLPELLRMARAKTAMTLALFVSWVFSLAIFTGLYPVNNMTMTITSNAHPVIDLFDKQYKESTTLASIPTEGIPDERLITNFEDLQWQGLFNRRIEAAHLSEHWASGFFPNWFGGIAGRWQDPNSMLLLRTLFGYSVAGSQEILEVLKESASNSDKRDFLFKLSPAEKYDLALGSYSFAATKSILGVTHNSPEWPKFWYGICNGMAVAADHYEEPYRSVDVINPNGFKIRFHPNDVKALLGYALFNLSQWSEIGASCNVNGPEAKNCRVNAGAFFLATMNRLGLAREAFVLDGFSGTRKQYYLFDAVQVDLLSGPQSADQLKDWVLPTSVKSLASVRFNMEFVSTLLSDKAGGEPDEVVGGDESYKKVGRVIVPRVLDAVIALDRNGNVIGGAWVGDENVPDLIGFYGREPALDGQNHLKINPAFSWPVIKKIYDQSIISSRARDPIDFSL